MAQAEADTLTVEEASVPRKFCVISFLERPSRNVVGDKCVPMSWIKMRARASGDATVVVAYPLEEPALTLERVERLRHPSPGWRLYMAIVVYITEFLEDAEHFIEFSLREAAFESTQEKPTEDSEHGKGECVIAANPPLENASDEALSSTMGEDEYFRYFRKDFRNKFERKPPPHMDESRFILTRYQEPLLVSLGQVYGSSTNTTRPPATGSHETRQYHDLEGGIHKPQYNHLLRGYRVDDRQLRYKRHCRQMLHWVRHSTAPRQPPSPPPGREELMPGSFVFVKSTNLARYKTLSRGVKQLTRLLVLEVFSEKAFIWNSPDSNRDTWYVRSRSLDRHATTTLLIFVITYGREKHWPFVEVEDIVKCLNARALELKQYYNFSLGSRSLPADDPLSLKYNKEDYVMGRYRQHVEGMNPSGLFSLHGDHLHVILRSHHLSPLQPYQRSELDRLRSPLAAELASCRKLKSTTYQIRFNTIHD